MSTCISSHGEFSEHSYGGPDPSDPTDCPAMDRFTCQLCGVFDTDACAKALDASERKRDDLGHRLAAMIRERDEWDADVFAAVVSERDELREQLAAMTRERDKWKRTAERRSTVAAAARCIVLEDQLRVAAEEAEYLRQWSNDLAALVPEGDEATYSDPEGAQESILRDVFTAYVRERDELRARLDAMTTEYGHRWGTGDITNHGTDREQAEQMVRRALACNHGPGVKFATTHALMARQVTGWAEVEEAGDGV